MKPSSRSPDKWLGMPTSTTLPFHSLVDELTRTSHILSDPAPRPSTRPQQHDIFKNPLLLQHYRFKSPAHPFGTKKSLTPTLKLGKDKQHQCAPSYTETLVPHILFRAYQEQGKKGCRRVLSSGRNPLSLHVAFQPCSLRLRAFGIRCAMERQAFWRLCDRLV
jgi:hypothetical protein